MHFHMQRFKFIVIELHFFKKKMKENTAKMWKPHFEILHMSYITVQLFFVYNWIFFTHSQLQIESENKQYSYIWFTMGIDQSNPYIHSTIVLCGIICRLILHLHLYIYTTYTRSILLLVDVNTTEQLYYQNNIAISNNKCKMVPHINQIYWGLYPSVI